ncbi:DEKNAAC104572 [Brettanomyces naardenensis]|uniref:DEKNAAC104572 n=1 Tax=Brettanomyces naardenensis TaxID=13370 RepID=A0A448YR31_BRENA|nr:DEKNAAC104572 [Brettanomyces naardenensis]
MQSNIVHENVQSDDPLVRRKRRRPHTRAAKACDKCRAQKVRCLKSDTSVRCLRCLSLKLDCSFENDRERNQAAPATIAHPMTSGSREPNVSSSPVPSTQFSLESRLDAISKDVKSVLQAISSVGAHSSANEEIQPLEDVGSSPDLVDSDVQLNMTDRLVLAAQNSPMNTMLKVSKSLNSVEEYDISFPRTVFSQLSTPSCSSMTSIICTGILDREESLKLLEIFRDRYGRWISFPDSFSSEKLLESIEERCPLLLTVACCLSVRYSAPALKQSCYLKLLKTIKLDLERTLLNPPLCLEYLQSIVILSIYGTSLSELPESDLCFDSWELSSFGIGVLLKMNRYGLLNRLYDINAVEPEFNELTAYRLWNTLVLVQLAYCLLFGRKSNYSLDLLMPKEVSEFGLSTKFDYRIISEALIYVANYRFSVLNGSVARAEEDIEAWMHRWNYMFGKPLNQFIEIDYHWTILLVLLGAHQFRIDLPVLLFVNETGSAGTVHDEIFVKVLFHTSKVIELMSSIKDDSYFAFLSDQIHMIVFYCCVVLTSLLSFQHEASKIDPSATDLFKVDETLSPIDLLERHIRRLEKVSTSESDTFFKYSILLDKKLKSGIPR